MTAPQNYIYFPHMAKNTVKPTKMPATFSEIIGQQEVKEQLLFLAEGANVNFGFCPPILLIAPKGGGKTTFAKAFGKTLNDEHGKPRKVITLNSSTVKSVANFFLNIYPKVLKHSSSGAVALFFDESDTLEKKFQKMMLSVLNPEKGMVRTIEHNGQEIEFDLRQIAFFFATTDPQAMDKALVDRLTQISLRPYNAAELAQILNIHLSDIKIAAEVLPLITATLRGNGRSAVLRAQEIDNLCKIDGLDEFSKKEWNKLKVRANIKPFGLMASEIEVLQILHDRGECTLQTLIATSGQTHSMLRSHLEPTLTRLGCMEINGKRQITPRGREVLDLCINGGDY